MIVLLDSGPLAQLANPKVPPATVAILVWTAGMHAAGHRFVVPAVADYEVRRELERSGKTAGIRSLDSWNSSDPKRDLPLTDAALKLAAKLWAQMRNAGTSTADPKELDGDVLIAAQALDLGLPMGDIVVATSNVNHLSRLVPANDWRNIKP